MIVSFVIMSAEQDNVTQGKALILGDPGRGAFVGEHAEYQERRLRQNDPVTVVSTSIHECYKAIFPNEPEFIGENRDHYELDALKLHGYSPLVVDQDELNKLAQQPR